MHTWTPKIREVLAHHRLKEPERQLVLRTVGGPGTILTFGAEEILLVQLVVGETPGLKGSVFRVVLLSASLLLACCHVSFCILTLPAFALVLHRDFLRMIAVLFSRLQSLLLAVLPPFLQVFLRGLRGAVSGAAALPGSVRPPEWGSLLKDVPGPHT